MTLNYFPEWAWWKGAITHVCTMCVLRSLTFTMPSSVSTSQLRTTRDSFSRVPRWIKTAARIYDSVYRKRNVSMSFKSPLIFTWFWLVGKILESLESNINNGCPVVCDSLPFTLFPLHSASSIDTTWFIFSFSLGSSFTKHSPFHAWRVFRRERVFPSPPLDLRFFATTPLKGVHFKKRIENVLKRMQT